MRARRMASVVMAAVTGLAAGVLAAVIHAAPASADRFARCYGPDVAEGCIPDNFNHWYCYDEGPGVINADFRAAIVYAMGNLDTQTSYADFFEPNGVCNTVSDVIWQVTTAVAPNRGDYACLSFNSAGNCEQARLRLHPTVLSNTANRRKTACHELGHSVGLRHGVFGAAVPEYYNDCMRTGSVNTETRFQRYNQHHINHANSRVVE